MANVNRNVYPIKTTSNDIEYTFNLKQLLDEKKTLALNTPYDLTIFPWAVSNIKYSAYVAHGGTGLEKVFEKTGTRIGFVSSTRETSTSAYVPTKNTEIYKNSTEGDLFCNWSPNARYSQYEYNSFNDIVTNFKYNNYSCGVIILAYKVKPENKTIARNSSNYKWFTSLSDYRKESSIYKYVSHVQLEPYSKLSNANSRSRNSNITHYTVGNFTFNFNEPITKYSLNFNMVESIAQGAYLKHETNLYYGIPVLGLYNKYGLPIYSGTVENIETTHTLNISSILKTCICHNDLTPTIQDETAQSDPENIYHTITAWFEISPDEILNQCLKYGVIIAESNPTDLTNSANDTYIPKIINGKVSKDSTHGAENATNPQVSWSNPWTDAKYDPYRPVDPNNYTDKIKLNKPNLTTTGIFNRTFALTASSIKSLSDYLWNADESIFNEIVKGLSLMGGNPIDGLIDLRLYPFDVSAKTSGGNSKSIVVGRTDTKVNGLEINDYNAVLELGNCTFYPYFGNFLDYEPFTTASLYIPYVGIVPISTADFMGQTISCKMVVDITTGSCTAIVFANDIPIIYKNGNIGVEIPMTGTNSAEYASRIAGGLTSGATDIALGAASKSVGQVVSGVGSIVDSALSVNNTMYNTAGSSSPACGLWQPQNCYFIIQRPVPIVPENYGHTVGYACNYQSKIGDCSGYTQTYNVDVSSINAPESEKNAIAEILNSGFYA